MSTASDWKTSNHQYLMYALNALQVEMAVHLSKNRTNATEKEFLQRFEESTPDPNALRKLETARAQLIAFRASMNTPPALEKLRTIFGLSSFETKLLLLCAGVELDAGFRQTVATAFNKTGNLQPNLSLALATLDEPSLGALSPNAPLRYWRILELSDTASLTGSPLKLDESILYYLIQLPFLDKRLSELVTPMHELTVLEPSQKKQAQAILAVLKTENGISSLPILQMTGSEPFDKLLMAASVSDSLGFMLYKLSVHLLPSGSREMQDMALLWSREAALHACALYVDATTLDLNDKVKTQMLVSFLENAKGLVFIDTGAWTPVFERPVVEFQTLKPLPEEQMKRWEKCLSDQALPPLESLENLVAQFSLGAGTIDKIAADALARKHDQQQGLEKYIWNKCRQTTRPRIDELAERIDTKTGWDDLVLPEALKTQLKEIVAQVRFRNKVYGEWGFADKSSRGLGISALFAGDSGTGKTMASEVVANELNLDLFRIDLSQVVNKYIGETEKNIKRIFDSAELGGAILLFDEADALFGKRSEVKDSHDRYSNIEVSYLLQRMESYRGLAILTTNMKNAIDKAFWRRIRFFVQFPYPDADMRSEIWEKVFPPGTPKEGLDYAQLSRLNVSGGNIRNIALNAAFLAAGENRAVGMSHILKSVRNEYGKLEKNLSLNEITGWE